MEMINKEKVQEICEEAGRVANVALEELRELAHEHDMAFALAVMNETGTLLCAKAMAMVADGDEERFKRMLKSLKQMIEAQARDFAKEERQWLN
jgi:radical SAM superfamily enzyme YgiQ (UPF0313 family)